MEDFRKKVEWRFKLDTMVCLCSLALYFMLKATPHKDRLTALYGVALGTALAVVMTSFDNKRKDN